MALDIAQLWNHGDPAGTEVRFLAALETATPDEAFILQTQIARTYGIRKQFEQARQILEGLQPQLSQASPEVNVRLWLEWGRTYSSATHNEESQTETLRNEARKAFTKAFELARDAKLDGFAIDALHMMAFVDTAPEDALAWNQKTLAYMEASSNPEAKKWEASLRNNLGYGLHGLGRYEEALEQFRLALEAREKQGEITNIRVAHWMIAWTFRAMKRYEQALEIQLRLERENDAGGTPDVYVYEELVELFEAINNPSEAARYRQLCKAPTA
jgi:tetratricopeptide (TPR) repeat protein